MDAIRAQIRKAKPNIRETSLNAYMTNLNIINKDLFEKSTWNQKYFSDFDTIQEYLETTKKSNSTKNSYIVSIIVYLKSCQNFPKESLVKYEQYLKKTGKIQEQHYEQQVQSKSEKDNWISLAEIEEIRTKVFIKYESEKNINNKLDLYQQYLLMSLYTKLAPIRNDYANVKIISNKEFIKTKNFDCKFNYIELETGNLVLCDYKTSKTYGTKIIKLPDELVEIISFWIKLREGHVTHDFLLVNKIEKTKMTKNGLTVYMNKIFFPRKISSSMIRKIYLSEKYPVVHSFEEQRKDFEIMGHSSVVQQKIYRKIM